jgi:hypothetical protein
MHLEFWNRLAQLSTPPREKRAASSNTSFEVFQSYELNPILWANFCTAHQSGFASPGAS